MTALLDKTAKIVVLKRENTMREGTEVHKRVGAVLRANGKPIETALRFGARTSTVRYLIKAQVIRITAAKSAK